MISTHGPRHPTSPARRRKTRPALRAADSAGRRQRLDRLALGRRAGSSIDFQDYREYQPGDDLRFIDWGIYARSDRLTVKLFREEVTPHLDLILDGSRSMNLENTAKAKAVAQLAALLATAAANAQCTQAVWLSGEGFQRLPNDTLRRRPGTNWNWNSQRTPEQSFDILPPKFRRLGVRVLISDLLWPGEPLQLLRRLREGAAALFVMQLLAREDADSAGARQSARG